MRFFSFVYLCVCLSSSRLRWTLTRAKCINCSGSPCLVVATPSLIYLPLSISRFRPSFAFSNFFRVVLDLPFPAKGNLLKHLLICWQPSSALLITPRLWWWKGSKTWKREKFNMIKLANYVAIQAEIWFENTCLSIFEFLFWKLAVHMPTRQTGQFWCIGSFQCFFLQKSLNIQDFKI